MRIAILCWQSYTPMTNAPKTIIEQIDLFSLHAPIVFPSQTMWFSPWDLFFHISSCSGAYDFNMKTPQANSHVNITCSVLGKQNIKLKLKRSTPILALTPENIQFNVREFEKFLLVESGILGFGIRNTAQGIQNPGNDRNPKSTFHWQSGIHGVEYVENIKSEGYVFNTSIFLKKTNGSTEKRE